MKLRPPPEQNAQERAAAEAAFAQLPKGDLLLKYQAATLDRLFAGVSLLVIEKSRRIGLTWGLAAYAVATAGAAAGAGGMNVWYMGYDMEMAREFIDTCTLWAKAFGIAAEAADEELIEDEQGDINAFRIRLASGFKIVALPSVPRALRGKQGLVIIDEAAFHKDLAEVLKAAIALLMWGGQVVVVSTHDGVDNPFNGLLNEVRAGKRKGETLTITFDDAIAAGLYERIALTFQVKGRKILPKEAWIADIRETYGDDAEEELDCIPARGSGAWLSFDQIERAEDPGAPVLRLALEDAFARQPDHLRRAFIQEWCEGSLLPLIEQLDLHIGYGVGGDFARSSDLSVIWPLAEQQDRSWRTPFTVEMRNVPYTEQEFVWKYLLSRLRRWKAAIDAAGNGGYLAERLVQAYGESRVAAVLTNSAWWLENGPPVKSRFEDGRITICRDRDQAADLRAVKVEKGVPTIPKARAREKGDAGGQKGGAKRHADAAVGLVMSGFALRLGPAEAIDFQSAGSALPAAGSRHDDRGFGVMSSELQIERF
ncbi:MAG: hypothetical protein ACK41C_10400 [Phenylobacterium sp.]|uniref:hypothetical protein n=1 Tax=Phenylobacterium sp. TaxID=1871053 RepID=UPI00391AC271